MRHLKKIIILVLVLPIMWVLLTKLAILGIAYWLGTAMCESTVNKAMNSPQGDYAAKVLEMDCGATTNWSTQVQLESLQFWNPYKDVVVSLQGRPAEVPVKMRWISNNKLEIIIPPNVKSYNKKNRWQNIEIMYALAE